MDLLSKGRSVVKSTASLSRTDRWLAEHGPKALESLFRAIVFRPFAPTLVTNDDRLILDASVGACKLLRMPREEIIGRSLEDIAEPGTQLLLGERWMAFLDERKRLDTLRVAGPDGVLRDVEYDLRPDVLPGHHLLLLCDHSQPNEKDTGSPWNGFPAHVRDYGLFLSDAHGHIAFWYSGAERIYQYKSGDVLGRHVSILRSSSGTRNEAIEKELKQAVGEGRFGNESWHLRGDGSRFWASAITVPLVDEAGRLQGFATVVRDFSDRREKDEQLRRSLGRVRTARVDSPIVGIVSGEYDRISETNEPFPALVGYSRAELLAGRLAWSDFTPDEHRGLDEIAHEEGLRFGASSPYEKALIRQDGTRVPVLVTTVVQSLVPFRWIAFVTDLQGRDRSESVGAEGVGPLPHTDGIVGASAAMKRVMGLVDVAAPTDATVLILGDTGTGKELVARAIHRLSPRKNLPFITLNCAAIPTGLLESELFGYEKGAFTGALAQKIGRIEMANRGTLFLDEVGDIPLDLQPKLLRALQEKSFERLGGTTTIAIDVRLVAATNRDLVQMVRAKLFRSDLYYRLKVFPITTPTLRDRPEDIPSLARHFTRKYSAKMDRKIDRIPKETMEALVAWAWPGNVRELENFIERSVILSPGSSLRAPVEELRTDTPEVDGDSALDHVERTHILRVIRETGGVITIAAARLGIPRTTLNALMKKFGISRGDR